MLVDDVFRLIGVIIEGELKGGMAVMCSSNSLSGLIVFSSALKDWLVHFKSDNVSGASRLLTMRTILVSFVSDSADTLKTAIVGVTSIAFQTVPLICNTTFDWPGSLQVTVADFATVPPKAAELNWRGME